jgi:hypothetical protein
MLEPAHTIKSTLNGSADLRSKHNEPLFLQIHSAKLRHRRWLGLRNEFHELYLGCTSQDRIP